MAKIYCTGSLVKAVGLTVWVNQDHRTHLSYFLLQRAHDFNGDQAGPAKAANVNGPRWAGAANLLDIGADHVRHVVDHWLSTIQPVRLDAIEGTVGPERMCDDRAQ